jgi:tRNA pseudouridine55 synthase
LPQVAEHLPKFIGTIVQRPPAYSAIQIGGKRLYDLARSHSLAPEQIPLRTVTIYQIRILAWQEGAFPHLTLEIECGSGTYIRSIARDLGEMLGCGATLFALTRTASNGFLLENSSSLEDIAHAYQPIPADTVLAHHDRLEIGGADLYRWRQGQALTISGAWHTPYLATYSQDGESRGELVGISIHQGDHVFPKVVL